ncbi:MAG: Polyphosphate kinase [Cytophagaceae bacterium]|jgi:polyphosphate kinase|nr:Polyphosphate kinase [Cytophagaceae bacterium]
MFWQKNNNNPVDSKYISRDLSWINFNYRVLDQTVHPDHNVFEAMKFLAITSSNLDEFFQIRIGSLYNYIDYGKERTDYSGLRETTFRRTLLAEVKAFYERQKEIYAQELKPAFHDAGFLIANLNDLSEEERQKADDYFKRILFPMLTPMTYDGYHSFPILMNKLMVLGVVTKNDGLIGEQKKLSFVQMPQNLPKFYEIIRGDLIIFVPTVEIIRAHIHKLFRNVEIVAVSSFRITRNGDFSVEESDDMEEQYIEEIKKKLMSRKTARVVRLETEPGMNEWMKSLLVQRWDIDEYNIFENTELIDYSALWQIVNHKEFKEELPSVKPPVKPLTLVEDEKTLDLFDYLKDHDLLLHHPYNSFNYVLDLIEEAAEDQNVLAIKVTIYRLAKNSRISAALLKAAENGKHVSVLFEVKARFDEENNIKEAQRLQKAGCFVVYGVNKYKTHTKLLLIVRKDSEEQVTSYVHLSSGNYNEETARLYTDISLLTTNEIYAQDISEFFNVITGHSRPGVYQSIITAPGDMRTELIDLILKEADNAREGKPSGIVIKINSLQDQAVIDALYTASGAGVKIKLIVRGICCLKPGKQGLSENITVRSIVGNFLEHSRIYYFHNQGDPVVLGGSADAMIRSFDRRIESLFKINDEKCKQEVIAMLQYNLLDNYNAYELDSQTNYTKVVPVPGEALFNMHEEFYKITEKEVQAAKVF